MTDTQRFESSTQLGSGHARLPLGKLERIKVAFIHYFCFWKWERGYRALDPNSDRVYHVSLVGQVLRRVRSGELPKQCVLGPETIAEFSRPLVPDALPVSNEELVRRVLGLIRIDPAYQSSHVLADGHEWQVLLRPGEHESLSCKVHDWGPAPRFRTYKEWASRHARPKA